MKVTEATRVWFLPQSILPKYLKGRLDTYVSPDGKTGFYATNDRDEVRFDEWVRRNASHAHCEWIDL